MIKYNYFAHTTPDGGDWANYLDRYGVQWNDAGEIIGYNYESDANTARAIVNAWMNSSCHRANILDPNFHRFGAGYAKGSDGKQMHSVLFTD
jgi:uncharacterized protein YkwD